jgi:hypothetical protein
MHERVGVIEETDDHKNLHDLGVAVAKLLHGSGVKF